MKIATIRMLLVVADLALVAGIGWVVTLGLQARNENATATTRFQDGIKKKLEDRKAQPVAKAAGPQYGAYLSRVKLSGAEPPPPEEPAKGAEVPVVSVKPPLETLVKVVAIQVGPGDPKSIAFLAKETSVPNAPAPKPEDAWKDVSFFEEGQAVEWTLGAVVKKISRHDVVFLYDGKEVTIKYKDPAPTTGPSGLPGTPGARPAPAVPNEDPKTWIALSGTNQSNVEITAVGLVSLQQKGEAAIEGVRWSSEPCPDGKPGLRIDAIPPGSVLETGGAKTGDVLHSINGDRVATRADVVAFVQRNPNLTMYLVKFYRQGVLHSRPVNIRR